MPCCAGSTARRRHRQHARLDLDRERHLDRQARPQRLVGILGHHLGRDRAGRACRPGCRRSRSCPARPSACAAGIVMSAIALAASARRKRAELALRHGKRHPDRLGLVDGDQRGGVLRAHRGAELGREAAGAAGDRRADGEIVELRLLRFEHGLAGGDAGLEALDGKARLIERRPRSRSSCRSAPRAAPASPRRRAGSPGPWRCWPPPARSAPSPAGRRGGTARRPP